MTRLLLTQREENARITCSCCVNQREQGFCRYPILMEYNHGSVRISRLISFSEDGLTCQLFREDKMEGPNWEELK